MALSHLIYVSNSCEASGPPQLDRILDSSVRHNMAQQITGMLLYADGGFMQVIEGEDAAIDETFGRIQADPRHTNIILIDRAPIAERSFPGWTMGFRRLGAEEAAAHPAYAPFFERGFDAAALGARPGLALTLLRSFALDRFA